MKRWLPIIFLALCALAQVDSLDVPDSLLGDTIDVGDSLAPDSTVTSTKTSVPEWMKKPVLPHHIFPTDGTPYARFSRGSSAGEADQAWLYSPSIYIAKHLPNPLFAGRSGIITYSLNGIPVETPLFGGPLLPMTSTIYTTYNPTSPTGPTIDISTTQHYSDQTITNLAIYQGSNGQESVGLNLNLAYWHPLQLNIAAGQYKADSYDFGYSSSYGLELQDFALRTAYNLGGNHAVAFDAFNVKNTIAFIPQRMDTVVDTTRITIKTDHSLYELSLYGRFPEKLRYSLGIRYQDIGYSGDYPPDPNTIYTAYTRIKPDALLIHSNRFTLDAPTATAFFSKSDVRDTRFGTDLSLPLRTKRFQMTPSISYETKGPQSSTDSLGNTVYHDRLVYGLANKYSLPGNASIFADFSAIRDIDYPEDQDTYLLTFGGQARLQKWLILRGEKQIIRNSNGITGEVNRLLLKYDDNPFLLSRIQAGIYFDILTKSESTLRPANIWGLNLAYCFAPIHGDLDIHIWSNVTHHSGNLPGDENGAIGLDSGISAEYWGFQLYITGENLLDQKFSTLPVYPLPRTYRLGINWTLID